MKLKSHRRVPPRPPAEPPGRHPAGAPEPVGVPVVNGEPVRPYELPDDPPGNQRELLRMARDEQRRIERDRSLFRRGVLAVLKTMTARKGKGFEVTLLRRWTFEFHRLSTSGGEKFRVEFYRRLRWDLNVEFWRSR